MKIKFLIILLLLCSLLTLAINAQEENKTRTAGDAIETARTIIVEINASGFNSIRLQDMLSNAEQLYAAQNALERDGGTADYSLVLERTKEIGDFYKIQIEMNDELLALERKLAEGDNKTAYPLFIEAKKEFQDERYEKLPDLIAKAYASISEEQALKTKAQSFYSASTKTISTFLSRLWKQLSVVLLILTLLYSFTHKRVKIFLIDRKITDLKMEREVLQKLTKKSQNEYFQLFKIPEELYYIRIAKFGELIRDIDRQLQLNAEDKQRLKGTEETGEKTSFKKRWKEKFSLLFLSLKKEKRKQIIPEEVAIRYGVNRRTAYLFFRAITSFSKLKTVIRGVQKQRREEQNIKQLLKKKRREEKFHLQEEKRRFRELLLLTKQQERERKKEQLWKNYILFKAEVYRKLQKFFHSGTRLKISKHGKEVLKNLKKRKEKSKNLEKIQQTKEEEYIQYLLQKRNAIQESRKK